MLARFQPRFSIAAFARGKCTAVLNPRPVVPAPRVLHVRTAAVYRQSAGRSFGSEDGSPASGPPEADDIIALRKSLFALENERDDVLRIGEEAAKKAVQMHEKVGQLNDLAVKHLQQRDEEGARSAVREKASTAEQEEKSAARAQANFALAAKIVQKIGFLQGKLRELGAVQTPSGGHRPRASSPAPPAWTPPPTQTPHQQTRAGQPSYPPQPPPQQQQQQQQYYTPPGTPPYTAPPSSPSQQYAAPSAPPQQPPQYYSPPQQPGGASGYPEVPKYEPINPSRAGAGSGTSQPGSSNSSPDAWATPPGSSAAPPGYSPGAPGYSAGGSGAAPFSPGSPLSPGYTPGAPKWETSLTEAQQRMADAGKGAPRWQVSLDEAQRRVREAEALGKSAVTSAEDRIFEAQERLRTSAGGGVERLFEQRSRMRSDSEQSISQGQERLREKDTEMMGYARRIVDRYKRGEYVSDEQLDYAFRLLERLTY